MRRNARPAVLTHPPAPPAGGDALFAFVMLLLHFDGANASTTFTDSSSNNWTMTAGGNAQLSTTTPKFGTACGLFDGSGDYVDAPVSGLFGITSGDFTCEAWIKPNTVAATRIIVSTRPAADRGISFYINSSGKLSFNAWDNAGNAIAIVSSSASISTSAYTHVAVTKSGSNYTLWINGVADGTVSTATAIGTTNTCSVARDRVVAGREFDGRIDEVRFTIGAARYTGTFTPPTAAFPNST